MARKRSETLTFFGTSFLDVLANTIGGLAFLLVLAVLLVGDLVFVPPEIMTEQLPDGYHGAEYSVWLGAREGMGKFRWEFGKGQRPNGLILDAKTGKLSGRLQLPAEIEEKQDYVFEVICKAVSPDNPENIKEVARKFKLDVYRKMPVPTVPLSILTTSPLPDAYQGQSYPFQFAAEGGQLPYSWSTPSEHLPPGLTLTPEGRLEGRPNRTGDYVFEVTVRTPRGQQESRSFHLAVYEKYPPPPPLKVVTEKIPAAVAKEAYMIYAAAEGGQPPYRWSLEGAGPGWLRLNDSSTAFLGTPALSDIGTREIRWKVTDKNGFQASSGPLQLTVLAPPGQTPPPPEIKTKMLPDARVGQPYHLAVAVEGGAPPYRWTIEPRNFCPGMTFSAKEGLFEGTPSRKGVFLVSIALTDAESRRTSVAYEFTVHPPLKPVEILTHQAGLGRVGSPYEIALSATGGYPPYHWALTGGQLPAGLEIDSQKGLLKGVPQQAGPFEVKLAVRDAEENASAEPLVLKGGILTEENTTPLEITTRSIPVLLTGRSSDIVFACVGGREPCRWQGSRLPEGLILDEEGRLSGIPNKAGCSRIWVQVTDAGGHQVRREFELTVRRMVPLWLPVILALLLAAALMTILRLLRSFASRKPVTVEPLRILTKSIPNARASCDYSVQLACIGGVGPYRWKVAEGTLPPGMTLSPEGQLYGRPFATIHVNDTKEINFTVEVKDSRGQTACQKL